MPDTKGVIKNILIRFRGETLVGLVCLVSGLIVAWKGVAGLRVLYRQFSVYFPLSPPLDIGRILLDSMPLIFASFISTMGSFCAVVLGVMWALSGAIDAVKGRKPTSAVPDFTQPEIVAESLRVGDSLHW
ncbi:MAG: hypothetical protein FJY85_21950, partial [Deltaproteobacteria bacterium]|nr:hypothetical protein [Deltaproteobacteria bacterium]